MTMFLRCLLVALVAAGASARTANSNESKVQRAFEKYDLVPDPVTKAPKHALFLKYRSGAEPNLGNELSLSEVQEKPVIISYPADCKSLYTIVFIDPDFKKGSDDKNDADDADDDYTQFLHFLVINVPGDQVEEGDTIADYVPPQSGTGSGYHRYTGVVYKQSGKIQKKDCVIVDRERFSLKDFEEKYPVGKPDSGNLFRARSEEDCADAD